MDKRWNKDETHQKIAFLTSSGFFLSLQSCISMLSRIIVRANWPTTEILNIKILRYSSALYVWEAHNLFPLLYNINILKWDRGDRCITTWDTTYLKFSIFLHHSRAKSMMIMHWFTVLFQQRQLKMQVNVCKLRHKKMQTILMLT